MLNFNVHTVFLSTAIDIIKIRWLWDYIIFIIDIFMIVALHIFILVRWHFCIQATPAIWNMDKYRIMYVLEWRTVSAFTRGLFLCLFSELRSNEGNKHKNNSRVSAETICHENAYIILFLTWYNEPINDDKNDDLYTSPHVSLVRSSFCWWCYNRLLMTSQ